MQFGEVGTFKTGGTPARSHPEYRGDAYPWISSTALGEMYVSSKHAVDWLSDIGLRKSSAKLIAPRSIMVGIRVGVGKCSISQEPLCTSQDVVSIEGIDESVFHLPFLVRLIESKQGYFDLVKRGATIKGITVDVLKNVSVPEIPLAEQVAKASTLNLLEQVVRRRKKQLDNLDELIKARFVEMFGDVRTNPYGWPIRAFEGLADVITDGEHSTPKRQSEGIYLVSARNVKEHELDLSDVDYIGEDEYERIARRIVPQMGDVLISCSGTIGRCCVIPAGLRLQMVRSVALLRFSDDVNPVFAEWLISSDDLQSQMKSSATQSSQANLFQGKIKKLRGMLPPLSLQQEFAAFVGQIDKLKSG